MPGATISIAPQAHRNSTLHSPNSTLKKTAREGEPPARRVRLRIYLTRMALKSTSLSGSFSTLPLSSL